jgi:Ca2+-binding EF-hand superfamily protein
MRKLLAWTMVFGFAAGTCGGAFAADGADKKKRDPEAQFKKLDKNSDGKLSLDEVKGKAEGKRAEAAEKRFKAADKDNDGALSLEEFKSMSEKKKKA